uniref:Uncharacterized protein n=1 Tax=Arundo donax TaxID=35708 RepID=A0A0A9GAN8_ARUDO
MLRWEQALHSAIGQVGAGSGSLPGRRASCAHGVCGARCGGHRRGGRSHGRQPGERRAVSGGEGERAGLHARRDGGGRGRRPSRTAAAVARAGQGKAQAAAATVPDLRAFPTWPGHR